ncbi:MAG: MarR family transcriptional regulator [Terrimicrobiaceae bacterium]|nr:MarR family transcriptional regulator [Terrimicrobiaceae bacterium]
MSALASGLSRPEIERLAEIIMTMQRCFVLHLSEELARGQVSFPQFFLMGHIAGSGPLSMSEIAEKMSHTTAAATGLVDRLENLGYVERHHDPMDRRRVRAAITPKGAELVDRIKSDIISKLSCLSEILTPHEQKTWLQIYEKIHHHITCTEKP